MATPARLQRSATRRNAPAPPRRVNIAPPSNNSIPNSGQQRPLQVPGGPQFHQPQGNQVLPLTVNRRVPKKKRVRP